MKKTPIIFYEEEQELEEVEAPVVESAPLFTVVLWRNTVEVYKCARCDSFRNKDQKDELIMHVLSHYSNDEEKEAVLDRLLKELN